MADYSNTKNINLKIYTKLEEIYSKSSIDNYIEAQYEDLRSKYNFLYKEDPTTIIRVPYTATLFGDTITQLFSNKIVTNLSSELIVLFNKNKINELNIKYFDNIQQIKTTIGEISQFNIFNKEDYNINDFALIGFLSAFKHIKSNNTNNGSNILIMLNNPNPEENDCYISIFLAMFLCCLYINDFKSINNNSINKYTLYEMVILSLIEICEQNKYLRNLINVNYYTPDVYFKIFLEKNNFGFNQGNLFFQSTISLDNSPLSLLVFDSLSPEPIKYYSSNKYWNKRRVEVRLAMALIIKRFKENISLEDLIKNSSTLEDFLKVFENNYEIVLKSIDVYLKKEVYNLSELKSEIPVDKLLKDINNFQGALLTKEFKLYERILFIIKEYQLVSLLYYKMKLGEKINWEETILKSAKLLRENYHCYSDEMLQTEAELKINFGENVAIKCISKGWSGKLCILGKNDELKKYEDYILKKYENLNQEKNGLVKAWISDDINKYCFISTLENGISILDPKYEDFMLEYIKDKNNIISDKVIEDKDLEESLKIL